MPYRKKATEAGCFIRIEKGHSSRYGSKGKCTRSSNFGKTPENMAKRNARYACMKANDIFNANFKQGDLTITYTFAPEKRPESVIETVKIWDNYIRRCRYAYAKAGVEFKWMKAIETPESNPHIHTVFSYIDLSLLPEWEYGHIHIVPMDNRDYHTYGGYLREQTHIKQGNKGKYTDVKPLQYYSHSRNLIIPEPKVTVISNDHWTEDPKAPKGYYIVKDSLNNWFDEVTGYKHQCYVLCKLPDKKSKKKNMRKRI